MKKIFLIIAFALISAFSYSQTLSDSEIYSYLENGAASVNSSCPTMVDNITRLDQLNVYHPKTIEYKYTVLLQKKDYNMTTLQNSLEPGLIQSIKTHPDMQLLRDYKVTFYYTYYDKFGVFMFTIKILPYQY